MSAPSVLRGKYFEGSGVVGIFVGTVAFALLAPLVGGLIDGVDRKLSARMQGRVGPRLLQPFYDVAKLLRKAPASVNTMDDTYMACALIFTVVGGGIFVSGSNTLLCAFMVTLAAIFVVLASASTQSPFAQVGADRELLQVMSYEPAVLLMSVGLYLSLIHICLHTEGCQLAGLPLHMETALREERAARPCARQCAGKVRGQPGGAPALQGCLLYTSRCV